MYKCIYVGKRTLSAILTMYSVSVSRRCTLRTDYICPEEPKTRQSTIEGAALQFSTRAPAGDGPATGRRITNITTCSLVFYDHSASNISLVFYDHRAFKA
jgi:hypothetical protein